MSVEVCIRSSSKTKASHHVWLQRDTGPSRRGKRYDPGTYRLRALEYAGLIAYLQYSLSTQYATGVVKEVPSFQAMQHSRASNTQSLTSISTLTGSTHRTATTTALRCTSSCCLRCKCTQCRRRLGQQSGLRQSCPPGQQPHRGQHLDRIQRGCSQSKVHRTVVLAVR